MKEREYEFSFARPAARMETPISQQAGEVGSASETGWRILRAVASWIPPLILVLLSMLPCTAQGQFSYTITNGSITITFYNGSGGAVTIPSKINGLPVTRIETLAFDDCASVTSVTIPDTVTSMGSNVFMGCFALTRVAIPSSVTNIASGLFYYCSGLNSVTIPDSVTSIGSVAFYYCGSLTNVTIGKSVTSIADRAFYACANLAGLYFRGNAPGVDPSAFSGDSQATVYYMPGAMGWGATLGGRPAVLWNPLAQSGGGSFGVRTNRFGFGITGSSNLVIVVEGCTNLANPVWSPLGTNTLTGGSSFFSDPKWTNYPGRFYRLRSP